MLRNEDVPLFIAVSTGRLDVVKQALDQGADVNATDVRRRSPLYFAIQKLEHCNLEDMANISTNHGDIHPTTRRMNIVKELLKRGANPNKKYVVGSFLECAIKMHNLELVKELINHGAKINVRDDRGHSLLHVAVRTGDLAIVEALLKAGADVNIQNYSGATPLLTALNDTDMVKVLLQYGANCNVTHSGMGCLSLSLRHCELGVIQELLKHGVDTSNIAEIYLAGAIVMGHRDVIKELLKYGVEFSGVLPYHLTVRNRDIDMALEFFKHRVIIGTKGGKCETLLDSIFASAVHVNQDVLTSEYTEQLIKYAVLVNFADNPGVVMESKNHDTVINRFYEHYCRLLSYFSKCEAELKQISSFRVNESFTLYDVTLQEFTGDKSQLVDCDGEILDQILPLLKRGKFPIYEECVISAVSKSLLVHKLIGYQVSLHEPNCSSEEKLLVPINIIDNVADYLSNQDLVHWLWAMEGV